MFGVISDWGLGSNFASLAPCLGDALGVAED